MSVGKSGMECFERVDVPFDLIRPFLCWSFFPLLFSAYAGSCVYGFLDLGPAELECGGKEEANKVPEMVGKEGVCLVVVEGGVCRASYVLWMGLDRGRRSTNAR